MKRLQFTALLLALTGCSTDRDEHRILTLATTTSTRDSGLLDALLPMFEEEAGVDVKVVAVGSGQALELGRRGDADVLLTHAPQAEELLIAQGHAERRQGVMHNDFVLVGPASDPAEITGRTSITQAFGQIASRSALFISRGDESGTHMKEGEVWQEAALEPQGDWYIEAGAGMAEVLRIANEQRAYTLADRATFLSQREWLDLTILCEGDPLLRNPYAVIVVSLHKHPSVNHEAAKRFSEFLLSPRVQRVIGECGVEQFGQPLFFPHSTQPGSS